MKWKGVVVVLTDESIFIIVFIANDANKIACGIDCLDAVFA